MIAFVLLRVLLILLLVAANAFFAAAEFSLVSVRDTRIQQLIASGRVGARIVQRLHQKLDEVVNGVQVGITMVSLTLGWIGEPMVARLVEGFQFVHKVPHAAVYAHSIAIAIAFSLITYLHVLLGELVPKTLALQRAEQIALAVAAPMEAFLTITRPFLFFMRKSGGLVLRIFGAQDSRRGGAVHSPDELKLIVTASRQFGQIPEFQEEMIHNAIELDSVRVSAVMVARPDIFSLPSDLTLDDALVRVVEGQHSRIPVYDPQRGPEHIVGVLYYKDLMRYMRLRLSNLGQPTASRITRMQIGHIMHDVLVVPETKVLAELLAEFKERRRGLTFQCRLRRGHIKFVFNIAHELLKDVLDRNHPSSGTELVDDHCKMAAALFEFGQQFRKHLGFRDDEDVMHDLPNLHPRDAAGGGLAQIAEAEPHV